MSLFLTSEDLKNNCNVCGNSSSKIFDALVLGKYTAQYFQCETCKFIQTQQPYWLNEAYATAITSIDVGLVFRNVQSSNTLPSILDIFSTENDSYIDYGGGYGMFVRMMRDKGYDFYLQDMYAENMFAKYFEVKDYKGKKKFAALTAFEVFEHLEDPVSELEKMFALSDTIIFSTELQPQPNLRKAEDWWYFTPETGQHISFYSKKSLEVLGGKYNCQFYTNGNNLHILSKRHLPKDPFIMEPNVPKTILQRIINRFSKKSFEPFAQRTSLLQKDFQLYRDKVNNTMSL